MQQYSERHDSWYGSMASEMLQHAGFQASVNSKLRLVSDRNGCWPDECRWVDDLWQIYGDMDVIDD